MAYILIGSLLIGLTLGLLGSGGSAITVPILVYLVGHGAKESIAESMAIVGMISIAAAIPYASSKLIDWRSVIFFGLPGMLGTLMGASLGGLATEALQLVVFGTVLLAAAFVMFRRARSAAGAHESLELPAHRAPIWKMACEGIGVGVLTGFVGVGGGFLIVPALVILGKLPMRNAIGTSLVIIVINATVGFAKYEHFLVSHQMSVNWHTILVFTLIGIAGSVAGHKLNARLNQHVLKTVFAGFLVLLGGFVIVHEGSKLVPAAARQAQTTTHNVSAVLPAQNRIATLTLQGEQ
ncbi:Sulfite exporter TauE/SafE [Gimesia panareensis]|uniref:Probable membrane transporter protein n=1 Tax=Gimesia panareensis TaxID=2527978 RepID=A0A517Q4D1_9PLAN|nr:sulfite exporter TauE/SafE family protein [Gimesia panareensis]QDT26468.1 Sulfite exporter TauE/SafE [Gimesia panareensis]